jgi:hypothetical protein
MRYELLQEDEKVRAAIEILQQRREAAAFIRGGSTAVSTSDGGGAGGMILDLCMVVVGMVPFCVTE